MGFSSGISSVGGGGGGSPSNTLLGTLSAAVVANLPASPNAGDTYQITTAGSFTGATTEINPAGAYFDINDFISWNAITSKWDLISANDIVDDTAFGVVWNGTTRKAPSQNALYDQMVTYAKLTTATRAIYVSKWGHDTNNSGLDPSLPKLTLGAAITAASDLGPDDYNHVEVRILGGGVFGGPVACANYVDIVGPAASIGGNFSGGTPLLTIANNSVHVDQVYTTGNAVAVSFVSSGLLKARYVSAMNTPIQATVGGKEAWIEVDTILGGYGGVGGEAAVYANGSNVIVRLNCPRLIGNTVGIYANTGAKIFATCDTIEVIRAGGAGIKCANGGIIGIKTNTITTGEGKIASLTDASSTATIYVDTVSFSGTETSVGSGSTLNYIKSSTLIPTAISTVANAAAIKYAIVFGG